MQEQNSTIFTPFKRVENLRVKRDWTWDQLANHLNVNRSLFFHLKAGKTNLSKRVMYRLAEAEREAGIEPPPERVENFRKAGELVALMGRHDKQLLKNLGNETRELNGIMNRCQERMKRIQDELDIILARQPDARFKKLVQPKNQTKEG